MGKVPAPALKRKQQPVATWLSKAQATALQLGRPGAPGPGETHRFPGRAQRSSEAVDVTPLSPGHTVTLLPMSPMPAGQTCTPARGTPHTDQSKMPVLFLVLQGSEPGDFHRATAPAPFFF